MSTTTNRTNLTGNLGADPTTRLNTDNLLIVTASIAVHSSFKQGDGWQERTDWFRLVAFGEAAEHLRQFRKGERISVQGRLQSSDYTDSTGVKRTSVEVVVLRSEDAPLPRTKQAEPEPLVEREPELVAEAEPVAEAPTEPAEQPTAKPRRRRKAA